jgi:hypothetical protein
MNGYPFRRLQVRSPELDKPGLRLGREAGKVAGPALQNQVLVQQDIFIQAPAVNVVDESLE